MWSISELKKCGKLAFKANYWRCVLTAFLLTVLAGGGALSSGSATSGTDIFKEGESAWQSIQNYFEENPASLVIIIIVAVLGLTAAILLKIFLLNPLEVGCNRFFKKNIEETPAQFNAVGEGFGDYGHVFGTLFLRDVFIWLWSLLFVIPGIIKSYSYRMVPYILKDEPELSPKEVLKRSKAMMKGNKWHAFVLDLSFLGWYLLGILTIGVLNFFWTEPYKQSTNAALYLALRKGE